MNKTAIAIITAVLSVDGLMALAVVMVILTIGSLIGSTWPSAPFWLSIVVGSIILLACFLTFIVAPLVIDFDDYED